MDGCDSLDKIYPFYSAMEKISKTKFKNTRNLMSSVVVAQVETIIDSHKSRMYLEKTRSLEKEAKEARSTADRLTLENMELKSKLTSNKGHSNSNTHSSDMVLVKKRKLSEMENEAEMLKYEAHKVSSENERLKKQLAAHRKSEVIVTNAAASEAEAEEERRKKMKSEISKLNSLISALDNDALIINQENTTLKSEIKSLKLRLLTSERKNDEIKLKLGEYSDEIEMLTSKLEEARDGSDIESLWKRLSNKDKVIDLLIEKSVQLESQLRQKQHAPPTPKKTARTKP